MTLVRGLIHVASLVALAAVAVAFGRWLRDPSLGALVALLLLVLIVAACVRRLYGPHGPATAPRRAPGPERAPGEALAAPPVEPLWAPPAPAPSGLDVNTATAAELQTLPGVGPTSARRIVAEREAGGPFRSTDDLTRVPGFGPARIRTLGDRVRI